MPLGQGIEELWDALRDRVEVSGTGPEYQVTAGSFDTALAYARERFEDPVVLDRHDRARWWPRVTLTVTTDRSRAAAAPSLDELAEPVVPAQRTLEEQAVAARAGGLPSSLEAIFAHQEEQRQARGRHAR